LTPHPDPWRTAAIGGIRTLALIMLAALLLRVILTPLYAYQPNGGFDEEAWKRWMEAISQHGVLDVFTTSDANYTGYIWVLAALSVIYRWMGGPYTNTSPGLHVLVKAPPIVFDLILIAVVYVAIFAVARALRDEGGDPAAPKRTQRLALAATAVVALHPAVVYDSAVWAQTDAGISAAMLGAIILCVSGRTGWGGTVWALGFLIKPQPIVIAPLLALIVLRRRSWRDTLAAAACISGTAAIVLGPWFAHGAGGEVLRVYRWNFKEHLPQLSPSAWNVWWIWEAVAGRSAPDDRVIAALPLTYRHVGSLFGLIAAAFSLWYANARPTLRGALLAGAYVAFSFYVLPVSTRERYGYPALLLLLPLVILTGRPLLLWLAMSATIFANMVAQAPPAAALRGTELIESPLGIALSFVNILLLAAFTVMLFLDARAAPAPPVARTFTRLRPPS
jgi:dolichyl-phosphate-mannose-protein mannosyltransferase